jgi:hypothetical protein
MTGTTMPPALSAAIDQLRIQYAGDGATYGDVIQCVAAAWDAVRYMGAGNDVEITTLAGRIAERELRLRLGLEREAARLDPENHAPR